VAGSFLGEDLINPLDCVAVTTEKGGMERVVRLSIEFCPKPFANVLLPRLILQQETPFVLRIFHHEFFRSIRRTVAENPIDCCDVAVLDRNERHGASRRVVS
jgi:hypothetical protein